VAEMFESSAFNGDISNWDTSSVAATYRMFADSAFNGDLSNWDVSNIPYMAEMFAGSRALSTDNYDKILQGWAAQEVRLNVPFDAGTTKYSPAAAPARSILVSKGWTISDGGMVE